MICFDDQQQKVLVDLSSLFFRSSSILSLFKKKHSAVYLHGPVGRGKTLLLKHFLNQTNSRKLCMHHERFMLFMYENLSLMHVDEFIKKLKKDFDILWIDEIQFRDMGETFLFIKVLKVLLENKTQVILSGNPSPDQLFDNVHVHPEAKKALLFFEENFYCIYLNGNRDYRNKVVGGQNLKHFFFKKDFELFQNQFKKMAEGHLIESRKILFKQRQWTIEKTYQKTAWLDFNDAVVDLRSAVDYETLTNSFDVFFLSVLPVLTSEHHEETKKLIVLVDLIYEKNKQLFLCAEALPKSIDQATKHTLRPFERTISRLTELCGVGYGLEPNNSNSE